MGFREQISSHDLQTRRGHKFRRWMKKQMNRFLRRNKLNEDRVAKRRYRGWTL